MCSKKLILRPEMSDIPEEVEKCEDCVENQGRSSRVSKLRELFQKDASLPKMFHSIKGSSFLIKQANTQTIDSTLKWKQYEERHKQRKKDRLKYILHEKLKNGTESKEVQKPPEISQELLSRKSTSTSTNMKGTLIEFSGGTSDFHQKTSVNTKSGESRFDQLNFVSSHDPLGSQDEDFLRILPPLLTPPTFSFFGKKNEPLVKEKESNTVFYESTVDSDQKKVRMSMINGHDLNKSAKNQRDQSVSVKSSKFRKNECQCKMQTLPTGVQTIDFTPFLVQLLESCIKVPHMLQNIRNVNNTFVSDLKSWRHYSKNLVNKVTDRSAKKSPSESLPKLDDREPCQTCNECHSILEKLMNLLNETKIKPCKNTLYPDGILCRRCGCDFQRDAKPFVPCSCKRVEEKPEIKPDDVIPQGKTVQISEAPRREPSTISTKPESALKDRRSSKYSGSIVSYHAQCCGPRYPLDGRNFARQVKSYLDYLKTPRCAFQDSDDEDTDMSSCCTSCSTCRSYSK